MILDKIAFLKNPPSNKMIKLWAKPVKGGFTLYMYFNGKWNPFIPMDSNGTRTTNDDFPMSMNSGSGGVEPIDPVELEIPLNSIGTEHIIDNSITMDDLNDEVRNILDDVYVRDSESLYIGGTKP